MALKTFFLKLLFFCSLILLLTPERLPNYLFRQIYDKNLWKSSLKGKKNFFFKFLFHIFPLLWSQKRKLFTFSTLFNTTNRKTARKNVHENFFFFFYFFLPTAPRNRKKLPLTFFSEIPRKKCWKIPLSALKFHFLQITFFPPWSREHTHTLCFTDP